MEESQKAAKGRGPWNGATFPVLSEGELASLDSESVPRASKLREGLKLLKFRRGWYQGSGIGDLDSASHHEGDRSHHEGDRSHSVTLTQH